MRALTGGFGDQENLRLIRAILKTLYFGAMNYACCVPAEFAMPA